MHQLIGRGVILEGAFPAVIEMEGKIEHMLREEVRRWRSRDDIDMDRPGATRLLAFTR